MVFCMRVVVHLTCYEHIRGYEDYLDLKDENKLIGGEKSLKRGRRGNSFGKRDGSQRGRQSGGRGRNQTSSCRHPTIRKNREK